jgi:hypothetical protein
MSLIEQLYDEKSVELIRAIYSEDLSSRQLLFKAFGQKIIEKQETFLIAKPLDLLSLMCMTASFADSPDECQEVAIIFFKRLNDSSPLPYISDDQGILLAEKTLVSLSLYAKAMEKRWKYKGAPSPNFYREASKLIFKKNNQKSIADHHEKWECFFSEIFI